ncbi:hypothetical protein ACM66B_006466 [Microbotryomycetes sp. NB124-2]
MDAVISSISSLPTNSIDVRPELHELLTSLTINTVPSGWQRRLTWIFVALHILILLLSVVGVVARYRKRTLWFFACDSNSGLWRPCPSVVPQVLFAMYTLFHATTFTLASYLPLGLALHAITWSTFCVASHASALPNFSPLIRREKSLWKAWAGVWVAVAFVVCIVPVLAYVTVLSRRVQDEWQGVLSIIDRQAVPPSQLSALLASLIPRFRSMTHETNRLHILYRVVVGLYGLWAVVWSLVYVPSALRLLIVLKQRIDHIKTSIKSLHVVNSLVDGTLKETTSAPLGEQAQVRSLLSRFGDTFKWPAREGATGEENPGEDRPSSPPELVITVPSPDLGDPFAATNRTKRKYHVTFQIDLDKSVRNPHEQTQTEARVVELLVDRVKVQRHLVVTCVQLAMTVVVLGSYIPLCTLVVVASRAVTDRQLVLLWISGTFVLPALLASVVFCYFGCVSISSRHSPGSSGPTTPTSPKSPDLLLSNPERSDGRAASPGALRRPRSSDELGRNKVRTMSSQHQMVQAFSKSGLLISPAPELDSAARRHCTTAQPSFSSSVVDVPKLTKPARAYVVAPKKSRPDTGESLIDPRMSLSDLRRPVSTNAPPKSNSTGTMDQGLKDLARLVAQELNAIRIRPSSRGT